MRRRLAVSVLAASVLATACRASPPPEDSRLPLEDCHIEGSTALCGTLLRPERPDDPEGRTISIAVAVIPASTGTRHAPLYLLAGGPGQGARKGFAPLLPALRAIGRTRDLVLVDQRGTGGSGALSCAKEDPTIAEQLSELVDHELLTKCLEGYDTDLKQYLTTIAMDDLDAVRAALGHERIDLYGGSYGTRAALVYARRHPEHTGKLVLDGVAPVDMAIPLSFARDAQAALDRMFADCAAEPACAAAYPDAAGAFSRWITAEPTPTTIVHPRTGVHEEVTLDKRVLASVVRGILYSPTLSVTLPYALHEAERGNLSPLVSSALALSDGLADVMSVGLMYAVLCSEDVPFIDADAVARETANTVIGTTLVDVFTEVCSLWPRAELEPGHREPVHSDAPALLLSGELDPVTPPRWAEHVLPHLPEGRHVIVPGAGHGTASIPCVAEVVEAFLDGDEPSLECVGTLERPPFFIDFAGPPA